MQPELLVATSPSPRSMYQCRRAGTGAVRQGARAVQAGHGLHHPRPARAAAQMCDKIAVMQRGEVVEYGETARVLSAPEHPAARKLIDQPSRA
ncbi:hypothetical protein ACU4GD_20910 [Cupriavidus basilensis]